jgi:DNA-binding NarL/FixJ family response regulator
MKKINIALADDQKIFAESLKSYIEIASEQLQVIGIAHNGQELLKIVEESKPDLVLLDVRMPVMDGVQTVKELKSRFPDVKAIMLSTFDDDKYVQKAVEYGAVGYLLKEDIDVEELLHVISAAFKGALIFSPNVLPGLMTTKTKMKTAENNIPINELPFWFSLLSRKEKKILHMILGGYENKEIADSLNFGEQTVKNYISIIYSEIGCHNRPGAVRIASPLKSYLEE